MQFYVKSIKYKVIISDFFSDCSVYWCPLRLDIRFAQPWKIFLDNPVQCCSSFPLIVSSLFLKVRSSEIYKSFAIFYHMQKYICTVYIERVNVSRLTCYPILIEFVSSAMSGWRSKNLFCACKAYPLQHRHISCLGCRRFILIFLTLFQQTKAILWHANSFHLHFLTFLSTQVPLL